MGDQNAAFLHHNILQNCHYARHLPRWQSRYLQSLTNQENSLHNSEKLLRCFTIPDDTAYSIRRLTVLSVQMEESGDKPSVKSRLWSTETLQPPQLFFSGTVRVQYSLTSFFQIFHTRKV